MRRGQRTVSPLRQASIWPGRKRRCFRIHIYLSLDRPSAKRVRTITSAVRVGCQKPHSSRTAAQASYRGFAGEDWWLREGKGAVWYKVGGVKGRHWKEAQSILHSNHWFEETGNRATQQRARKAAGFCQWQHRADAERRGEAAPPLNVAGEGCPRQ